MTINELVHQSYSLAKEKGWHDQPRDIEDSLLLIHSEISEALEEIRAGNDPREIYYSEDYKNPKPLGFPIELADILIRCFDLAGEQGVKLQKWLAGSTLTSVPLYVNAPTSITKHLWYLHCRICAFDDTDDLDFVLQDIITGTISLARLCDIRIEKAVEIKHEYNKTRPYRHGKVL